MSRFCRTPLVLAMLVSLVFTGYWQVFVAQKAKAVEPPAPGSTSIRYAFTNPNNNEITLDYDSGAGNQIVNFKFGSSSKVALSDFSSGDKPTSTVGGETLDESNIFSFQMSWAGAQGAPLGCQVNNGPLSPLYIVSYAVMVNGVFSRNRSAGIYLKVMRSGFSDTSTEFVRVKNSQFFATDLCGNLASGFTDDMIRKANSSDPGGIGSPINWALNAADKAAVCADLTRTWEAVKDDMRELLTNAPPGKYWKDVGTSAYDSAISLAYANIALGGTIGMAGGFPGAAIGIISGIVLTRLETSGTGAPGSNLTSTVKWVTNDAGNQLLGTIYSKAIQLRKDISYLNDGTNGGTWPCETKLIKLKWDKALEVGPTADTFATLDEFSAAVDETIRQFEKFKGIITTPTVVGPDNNSACGGLTGNLFSGGFMGILNGMFCGVGEWLHQAAAYLMRKAFELLVAFIGVDVNINPNDVNKPADTTTGGGGTTPGSTTPPAATTVDQKAIELCNQRKPPTTPQADWDKGPCLSQNIDNTGYAVDVAHQPRTDVDNANTCTSPTKWIELNTSCSIIGRQD